MHTEPRAIAVAAFVAATALAVMLWLNGRQARHAQASSLWAMGSLMLSAGALINVAQGDIHPVLAYVVGNPMMLLGTGLIVRGVRLAQLRSTPLWWVIVPVGLMAVASAYWSMATPNFNARVIVYSSLMSASMASLVWSLLPWRLGQMRVAAWFVGVPAAALVLTLAVRTVVTMLVGAEPVAAGGGLTSLTYLVGSSSVVAILVGLILAHQLLLLEDLRRAAERDSLTGLLNRRSLQELVPARLEGYALLAMDIDLFKRVNDAYGHSAGDDVLAFLGQLLNRTLREGDLAARMGGEEFCLLLKQPDAKLALQVAERLRSEVATQSATLAAGPITVSMGLAVAVPDESFETLTRRADAGLYLAKANGRNRCEQQAVDTLVTEPVPLERSAP